MLWQVEDKYNLLGGVIGAFITITVIRSMGSLGPARAVMLIVISQLAVAYLIELLGIFRCGKSRFSVEKAVGNADLYCRCSYFQMEIEIKYCNICNTSLK